MGLFKDRELELKAIIALMTALNENNDLDKNIQDAKTFLKSWSACQTVEINLIKNQKLTPFSSKETKSDSKEHECMKEWVLMTHEDTHFLICTCGEIVHIEGEYAQFTGRGDLWCNNASRMQLLNSEGTPYHFKNFSDESILLINLKSGDDYFGTIRMSDPKPDFFIESTALFYEQIAINISTSISRSFTNDALKMSEHRYQNTLDNMLEGAQIIGFDWSYLYVNDTFVSHSKYPKETLLNSNVLDLYPGIEKTMIYDVYQRCFKERVSIHVENEFVFPDGSMGWFDLNFQPVPEGIFILSIDITERKLAEIQLEKQNKELQAMIKELEQFAYIASHDLQEPLRTLTSFAGLIQKEFSGQLGEKGEKYLEFIMSSSARMSDLIKGLLDYSRIGKERTLKTVDCNSLVDQVLFDMDLVIKEKAAQITYRKLPQLTAYELELRQLFQNLISNAIKFTKNDQIPKIEITAHKQDQCWHFAVKDNGIGIEQEDLEKIFIIFKRLHNRSEYEGSGIGLSYCKKIVELHHGTIWVESTPNEGSTFYFTIPIDKQTKANNK